MPLLIPRRAVHTSYKGAASIENVKSDIIEATGAARDVWAMDNLYFGYPDFQRYYQRCYIILDGYYYGEMHEDEYCGKVYVPSQAVLERYNWRITPRVVPHAVRFLLPPKQDYKVPFLYIAGLAPRKYPPGSDVVIKQLGSNFLVYTVDLNPYGADRSVEEYATKLNPYYPVNTKAYTLSRFQLYKLYRSAKFYLSLSGNGAFEMTPLEAMASGTPPITLDVKPFTEYNNCGLTFHATGVYRTPFTDIYLYDPMEVVEVAKYAMGMGKEEYYDMSSRCVQTAKSYYFLSVYKQLFD